MLPLVGQILILALVVAGLLMIVGLRRQAAKLVGWVIAVALIVSVLSAAWQRLVVATGHAASAGQAVDVELVGGVLLLVVVVAWGGVRFVMRRRRLRTFIARGRQTSLKRRLDRS